MYLKCLESHTHTQQQVKGNGIQDKKKKQQQQPTTMNNGYFAYKYLGFV